MAESANFLKRVESTFSFLLINTALIVRRYNLKWHLFEGALSVYAKVFLEARLNLSLLPSLLDC